MTKRKLFLQKPVVMILGICCTACSTVTMDTDFDKLTNRLVATTVNSETKKAYQEEYADLTAKVTELIKTQTAAGCWADINYADTESNDGWDPQTHLHRLIALAAEYEINTTASVREGVLKALDCWYKDNPTASSPTSVNWWWDDIGKQKYLGPTGLIMINDLSKEQLANLIADMPTTPSMTGANRSDISKGIIYGGLLSQDANRISNGISGILDTVATTESEGMQVDMSWLQHGPQLHNGSYGQEWVNTALPWAYYVRDLQWKFPVDKSKLIANFILEGDQWMTRPKGGMDYSTAGRSISRSPKVRSSLDTIDTLNSERIAKIAPNRAADAQSYQNFLDTGVANKTGFKHFWRADYSVSRRENYTFSIHMASTDVALQEHGNDENQLGYWMGFGNTFLYKNGAEYKDIFPVWRWDVMSGVTAPQVSLIRKSTWGYNFQNSTFVGAATDGNYGVTVMDFVHTDPTTDNDDTFAKKAWFSFEDEIVALGAGILSTRAENIVTTVNETLLNGTVTVDGNEYTQGARELVNARWVHHDDVAYIFPTTWSGQLENDTRTGNWADLNPSNASEKISKDTFFLSIDHGIEPTNASYQYIIVPGVNTTETQAYYDALPVSIIANSATNQAVRHSDLNMTGIIFYTAGSLELYTGFTVTVDKPSVLLINESGNYPVVSISTPGTSDTVTVTLDSAVLGKLVKTINTPSSVAEMGKTVTVTFNDNA